MSGYKPDYSEIHSPWHRDGHRDATIDAGLVGNCPPLPPNGPDPYKRKSVMYMRGYNSVPQVPHICTERCQR